MSKYLFSTLQCDLGKPQCTRCVRAGRACEGYDRERHFVHTSSIDMQKSWKTVLGPSHLRCSSHNDSDDDDDDNDKGYKDDNNDNKHIVSSPRPSSSSGSTKEDVFASASAAPVPAVDINMNPEVQSQLLSVFMDAYIPSFPADSRLVKANFIVELPAQLGRALALDLAIVALCSVFVGSSNKDEPLRQYGITMYGKAMRALRVAIQRHGKASDDTLYAIAVLQVYEVCSSHMHIYKNISN